MGNLGEKQWNINELKLNKRKQRVQLLCTTGVISNVSAYGAAKVEKSGDEIVSYDEDTYCDVELDNRNKFAFD